MDILNFGMYVFLLPANIIGNSVVCVLFRKADNNASITNHLLLNLAVSDLLSGCVVLVCKVVVSISVESTNNFYCKIIGASLYLTSGVSVLTLMIIAVERYYSIMRPALHLIYTRDRRSRKVIHLTWLIAIAFVTPMVVFLENVKFAERHVTICGFVNSRDSQQAGPIYDAFVVMLVFLVPNLVIFYLYGRIILNLWFCRKFQTQSHKVVLKARRSLTRMLVIVTAVFSICWFPYYLRTVRALVLGENNYAVSVVCRLLVALNSCANPVIYTLYSPRFRRKLKQLCCRRPIRPSRKVAALHASTGTHDVTTHDVTRAILSMQHLPYLISLTQPE